MKKTKMLWTSLLLLGTLGGVAGMSASLVSCSADDNNEEVKNPPFPKVECKVIFDKSIYEPSATIEPKFPKDAFDKIIANEKQRITKHINFINNDANTLFLYVGNYQCSYELKDNVFSIAYSETILTKLAMNPNKPKVLSIVEVKWTSKTNYTLVSNANGMYPFFNEAKTLSIWDKSTNERYNVENLPEHLKSNFVTERHDQPITLDKLKEGIEPLYPKESKVI